LGAPGRGASPPAGTFSAPNTREGKWGARPPPPLFVLRAKKE